LSVFDRVPLDPQRVGLGRPADAEPCSQTSLRRKPIKIGAEVVSHGRCVTFGMAEVAMSRKALKEILMLIARLRAPPAPPAPA
jgi:hypothetical protein